MFNLLITARSFGFSSDLARKAFQTIAEITIEKPDHTKAFDEDQMCELIPDRDAVIVGTDQITQQVIAKANKLNFIFKHGVGIDNVDLEAATKANILVANMPGINNRAVADMTLGLILALSRGICLACMRVKKRDWSKFLAHDIWGKTLGIVGTGNIGLEVIKRALAFDMKVFAFDTLPNEKIAQELDFSYMDLDSLLTNSDMVSLHVPLTPDTIGMIGKREIGMMKPSAYLINTSRGGIIDEAALLEALQGKIIAGAALDVYDNNLVQKEQIYSLDNLIITPHIAAYTYETLENMDMELVEAFKSILRGKKPTNLNILNPCVQFDRSAF